jgi:hypothetical protein
MSLQETDDLKRRSMTVQEFCRTESMSLSTYYKMRRLGYAPTELHIPQTAVVRITHEAHREWRERMVKLGQSKQAELERQRRSAQRRAAGESAAASPKHISRCRAGRK